jgi:hypothetical protein
MANLVHCSAFPAAASLSKSKRQNWLDNTVGAEAFFNVGTNANANVGFGRWSAA